MAKRIIKCLNDSGLDYAFTGALAVSYYGIPRTTSDVDVMITIRNERSEINKIIGTLLCVGLDVTEQQIMNALQSGYNIITASDKASPYTVDIITSTQKIEKRAGKVAGLTTYLQEPIDLILAKLRMIKATIPRERAIKDEDDIKSIIRFTPIDLDSLRKRAKTEGTEDIIDSINLSERS